MNKPVLIVSDNNVLVRRVRHILEKPSFRLIKFEFACTDKLIWDKDESLNLINIKSQYDDLPGKYSLIISLHCKQIFPKELVHSIKCINVHPGFNPYNRGWYPQVFSIQNKLPIGATIHEIDEFLDHGNIIDQVEVPMHAWDTSLSLYERINDAEIELIEKNLINIINNTYTSFPMPVEGNINLLKDFRKLCKLELDEVNSAQYFIDKFRSMTHGGFKNLYFIDPVTYKKIYIKINLEMVDE